MIIKSMICQLRRNSLRSPFVMNVFPKFDTRKVQVSGDTQKKKLPASLPAKFQIDTKKAGKADINVTIKVWNGMFSFNSDDYQNLFTESTR